MSLDTLLEAAKYLDHIQKTESSDGERHDSIGTDSFEDSEEVVLPSATYHLKVDPNLPISVQFHTYTSCVAELPPMAAMANPVDLMSNSWNTSNRSTKRNSHQNVGHVMNDVNNTSNTSTIRPSINSNNFVVNKTNVNNNRDHSSYSRHREMHKTLEKNRRAHLRHCFDVLKDQLPPNEYSDKKSSHINIISCAIRYIHHLKRTESELQHQTERLVRTRIRFQNQIAQLKEDLKDINIKSTIGGIGGMTGIGGIGALLQADQTHNSLYSVSDCGQYEIPIDEQSDEEVIIELGGKGEDCYDDETTTTASECADDIRESGNTSKLSGSLANALIYKCHA